MRKIFVIIAIFFSFFYKVFSFEAELSFDKETIKMGESVTLSLNIKNIEDFEHLKILEMDLEENFEVIGKQQSSKTSIQSKIIDGKIEEKRDILANINFVLYPKKIGFLETGSIILSDGNEKIETNSVKIEVLKNEVSIKNTLENTKNFPKDKALGGYFDFLMIILFSIVFLLIILFIKIYLNRKKNNSFQNDEEIFDDKNENLEKEKNINYENLDNILELDDKNFATEVEKILKNKILERYNLILENKGIGENLDKITNDYDRNLLNEITISLNKINYSNLEVDKKEVFENLEKFIKNNNL